MPPATLSGTEHHPHAAAVLGAALEGAPSHAYLFHGPAGTGKRGVARAFAAELLAEGAGDPESTRARVGRGVHPDLTWVTPSGAHELLVGDVDEPVVAAATRTPFEARRRVFVVEAVDTMNDEAGNRMLKTLEEPAAYAHLILLTDRPADVLPTIASRCQPVRFDPLPEAEIVARLSRQSVETAPARACARLALGDARRAAELATGEGPR
ncbi:MAG: DNA polymerase III subunit delta', partial [Actinomycetota bacterium]|nr:DNA polymerase III subunit delta' [Actinomycetota bacterium]